MNQPSDISALELLARDMRTPLSEVTALFERERDSLAESATITNYVTLLAVRRVRNQLRQSNSHH